MCAGAQGAKADCALRGSREDITGRGLFGFCVLAGASPGMSSRQLSVHSNVICCAIPESGLRQRQTERFDRPYVIYDFAVKDPIFRVFSASCENLHLSQPTGAIMWLADLTGRATGSSLLCMAFITALGSAGTADLLTIIPDQLTANAAPGDTLFFDADILDRTNQALESTRFNLRTR